MSLEKNNTISEKIETEKEIEKIILEKVEKKINDFKKDFLRNKELKEHYNKEVLWVSPKTPRYIYIKEKIKEYFEKYWKKNKDAIPWEILWNLALLSIWLVAEESKYNNDAKNPKTWAFSMFQITDNSLINQIKTWILERNSQLSEEERKKIKFLKNKPKEEILKSKYYNDLRTWLKYTIKKSMKKLVEYYILEMEYLWKKLNIIKDEKWKEKKELTLFLGLFKKIWMTDIKEKRLFKTYMLINAYNAWPERIRILIKEFSKKYSWPKINNAKVLLYKISEFWKKYIKWYWPQAADYVFKVIAWYRAVEELNKKDKKETIKNHTKREVQKIKIEKQSQIKEFYNWLKEHWKEIPTEIKNFLDKKSKEFLKLVDSYSKKWIHINNNKKWDYRPHWFCAYWVKKILRDSGIDNIWKMNAYPMFDYFSKNSVSLEEYKKWKRAKYLKIKIDFPEQAYPWWIVVYWTKKTHKNLVWSNARKKYGHVEIVLRDNEKNPVYKYTSKIKWKEIIENLRFVYDWITIVPSWSTFNYLWRNFQGSHQDKLLKAEKQLILKWKEEYRKKTWFLGYVFYPIEK